MFRKFTTEKGDRCFCQWLIVINQVLWSVRQTVTFAFGVVIYGVVKTQQMAATTKKAVK
jgi:hypothetical protein